MTGVSLLSTGVATPRWHQAVPRLASQPGAKVWRGRAEVNQPASHSVRRLITERSRLSKAIVRCGTGFCDDRWGMIRGDGFNDRKAAAEAILRHEEAEIATTEEGTDGWTV